MYAGSWEAPASYDRRSQQFRCKCCRKIIGEGEAAIFSPKGDDPKSGNRSWAIPAECGDAGKAHSGRRGWGAGGGAPQAARGSRRIHGPGDRGRRVRALR